MIPTNPIKNTPTKENQKFTATANPIINKLIKSKNKNY